MTTTAVSEYDPGMASGWGAGTEDVTPSFPSITLIQKAMPNIPNSGKHAGEFHLESDDFRHVFNGVILWVGKSQTLFDDDPKATDRVPVCAADDGLHPRDGSTVWQTGSFFMKGAKEATDIEWAYGIPKGDVPRSCAACPLKDWMDGPGGKRIPPPCKESYRVLLTETESGNVYRFAFRSTAVRGFRQFLGMLKGSGYNIRRGAEELPVWAKEVAISSIEVDDKAHNSVYWTPGINVVGPTPPDMLDGVREAAAMIARSARRQDLYGDDPEMDDAAQPAPAARAGTALDADRDYGDLWTEVRALGLEPEDYTSTLAPLRPSDLTDAELWEVLTQLAVARDTVTKAEKLTAGERRLVVEKVRGERMAPLPEVTPADLTPRSDVTAAKQASLK